MSYSVLRKGQVIMSNFSTQQEAQKYVDSKTSGWGGDPKEWYEIKDDGGCYLTTAAVDYHGLPDNCEELNVLRNFRDHYLSQQLSGSDEIKHYYNTAPKIVQAISQSINKSRYLESIYNDLIIPCVTLIKQGNNKEAHHRYKTYTLNLEKELL